MSEKNRFGLSRDIPENVKLAVRKRCKFGCVVCGAIPFDYDHFAPPFVDCQKHDPEGIILLCQNHHRKRQSGFLTDEFVLDCLEKIRSTKRDSRFMIETRNTDFAVNWASARFVNCGACIQLADEKVFEITKTGIPLDPIHISATLRDASGSIICRIHKNEIIAMADSVGDFTCTANRLLYKDKNQNTIIEMEVTSDELLMKRLHISYKDCFVDMDQKTFLCGNSSHHILLTGTRYANARAAILVEAGRLRNELRRQSEQRPIPVRGGVMGITLDAGGAEHAVVVEG